MMRSIRGLAATALLPLALLACGGGDDEPEAEPAPPSTAETTTTAATGSEPPASDAPAGDAPADDAPVGELPDICTVVDAARVEEIMQGPPARAIPATHEGGGASCSWAIEGTSHGLSIAVYRSEVGAPDDRPVVEGVFGGFQTTVGSDVQAEWVAESHSTFATDPGREMTPILQQLNDEVLAAVAA